jgi:hypothetical protein
VTKVGPDTIRNVPATHYRGSVPLDAAHLNKLGGVLKVGAQKLLDQGITSLPFDAWLDAKGRLVRLKEQLSATMSGITADVTTTLDRYGFGTPVNVVAPPLSEQKDGTALLKAALTHSG